MQDGTIDRDTLLKTWQAVTGGPAPLGLNRHTLELCLAYHTQAQNRGGWQKTLLKGLIREGGGSVSNALPSSGKLGLRPGARLMREWRGKMIIVDVTEEGFHFEGVTYASLSIIARTVTGAHWSGPRFFGLNKAAAA